MTPGHPSRSATLDERRAARERAPAFHLHALGHFHPEPEITNRFLEELDIGTTDAWIVERVGIRSRRTVLPLDYLRETRNCDPRAALEASLYGHAELSRRAAELALARAGLPADAIGLVISGSSVPESLTPAEACVAAEALGIEAPAYDLNSACTSFLAQLHALASMRPEALPDYVLLLAVDTVTRVCDYGDRASAVLWGDAATAAVVSPRVAGRARIEATALASAPSGQAKVRVPRAGYFAQEGRAVQSFAIKKTCEGLSALQSEPAAREAAALHFVGHQANLRVLEAACERCAVPAGRHHMNVEHFGNTGAPGAPSVVSQLWEKWGPGDAIALVGVGAGLTWGRALLRFEAAA